jgi:hypothetical protein
MVSRSCGIEQIADPDGGLLPAGLDEPPHADFGGSLTAIR